MEGKINAPDTKALTKQNLFSLFLILVSSTLFDSFFKVKN